MGWLEVLAMKTWLEHGHDVTVFSYEPIDILPDGVEWVDAREIFPTDRIFIHKRTATPSCHADIFRAKMLQQTDMIWMDLDFLLIKSFNSESEFVFSPEKSDAPQGIGNSVLKLPPDSPALKLMLDKFDKVVSGEHSYDSSLILEDSVYGAFGTGLPAENLDMYIAEFGPALLSNVLKQTGEIAHASNWDKFYPLSIKDTLHLAGVSYEEVMENLSPEAYGVHLWATRFKHSLAKASYKPTEKAYNSFIIKMANKYRVNYLALPCLQPENRLNSSLHQARRKIFSMPSPKLSRRIEDRAYSNC